MTLAICIRCGHQKLGAFTLCRNCGFEPSSADDLARSLALCDATKNDAELRVVGARIRGGVDHEYNADELARLSAAIGTGDLRPSLGCRVLVWAPVVVMILLAILVVVVFTIA